MFISHLLTDWQSDFSMCDFVQNHFVPFDLHPLVRLLYAEDMHQQTLTVE
jgi:hypothetical protein